MSVIVSQPVLFLPLSQLVLTFHRPQRHQQVWTPELV